ncbi:MAG TPA: MopE-related protein [Chitinophagales bacterium]|nr:MopE-related protein [Chitinophagales bacterium]HRH53261.1 MopE-related protein [Chitinophagales bacterium]
MKIYCTILFIAVVKIIQAQAPEIQWSKSFGGSNQEDLSAIVQCLDDGYAAIGGTYSNDLDVIGQHGNQDIWLIKLDELGVLTWSKCYGGTNSDYGYDIIQTKDTGFAIIGNTFSNSGDITENKGLNDVWIIKTDSMGNMQWQKTYGGSSADIGRSIEQTLDGGYIFSGYTASEDFDVTSNNGFSDYWVVKIDSVGGIQWQRTYGGSSVDQSRSIISTSENEYIVVGYSKSSDYDVTENKGEWDYWVLKLNNSGDIIWEKSFGGTNFEEAVSVDLLNNGNIVVGGYTQSSDGDIIDYRGGLYDYWILCLDTAGNSIWRKCFGGSKTDICSSVSISTDNKILLNGYSGSDDLDVSGHHGELVYSDFWVVNLDSNGLLQWEKSLGGTLSDQGNTIINTNDNSLVVAGWAESIDGDLALNYGFWDSWVIKLEPPCNLIMWYADADLDGFGDLNSDSLSCDMPIGYILDSTDCDDLNFDVNPVKDELCNGIDDNCNIEIDEGLTIYTFYIDVDGDTYGNPDASIDTCIETIIGYVNNNLDCNDTIAGIYPGAIELCNYLDDDCDGITDDNLTYLLSYQDNDDDDFGNPLMDSLSCGLPLGYVVNNTDCDDTNAEIYPGANETLNGLDDDCDQIADEGLAVNDIVKNTIHIFPNPVNTILFIQSNETQNITIVNQLGEEILHTNLFIGLNTISVADFASGMYWVKAENGEMVVWVKE